jgi:hypothetical protein
MTLPALTVYANGGISVSGDNLNTMVQSAPTAANLRTLVGIVGMAVALQGSVVAGDGYAGLFYWNAASVAPDDGINVIVPPAAATGAWNRLGTLGTSTGLTVSGSPSILTPEIGQGSPYQNSYSLASFAATTVSNVAREYMVSMNFTSTLGAPGNNLATDKVSLFVGMEAKAGTGDAWAFNPILLMDAGSGGTYVAQAIEVDLVNSQGHRGDTDFTNASYILNLTATSSSTVYRNTSGILISGPGASPTLNRGISFVNNAIYQVSLLDLTNSPYVLQVGAGTHTIGVDLSGGTFSSAAARFPNNAALVGLNVAATAAYPLITATTTNYCAIGSSSWAGIQANNNILPSSDNTWTLGANGARWTAVWAVNGAIQTSDPALKNDIVPVGHLSVSPLDLVKQIEPITFKWKDGGYDVGDSPIGEIEERGWGVKVHRHVEAPALTLRPGRRTHWGFDAQAVGEVFKGAGLDFGGYVMAPDGTQSIRPDQFVPVLWAAVKELAAEVATLRARPGP